MRNSISLRWLAMAISAAMILAVAAACGTERVEVPGETVVVEKEVIKTVEVPGETIVKEVVKTVEVPGETVVVEKVVTETVEVPGETVVVEKVVTETVEVPKEVVVEKEVVKTVEVEVPKEVVVEKEVEVVKTVVKEVAGKKYVTDPVIGNVIPAPEYGGTFAFASRNTFDRRMDPYVGGPSMSAIASG